MNRQRGWVIGRSVLGAPIHARSTTARRTRVAGLILGTMHGDEPKSAYVVRRLWDELAAWPSASELVPCVIVPVVNPDGYARRRRRNARGVDLNRNFPTTDWSPAATRSRHHPGSRPLSEPESRAIHRLVLRVRPAWIVTVHSISNHMFCNNYDGPGRWLARLFARHNRYPVRETIGYPTPGSFGRWAGKERGVAVLTLELPSHHSPQRCWRDNAPAFRRLLTAPDRLS